MQSGLCPAHQAQRRREQDRDRGSASERLYDSKWQQARAGFLRKHPLCMCPVCDEGRVRITPATVVDHKIPHRGNKVLFWDRTNWQSMSKPCHDRKTATEDGGFGRRTDTVHGRG